MTRNMKRLDNRGLEAHHQLQRTRLALRLIPNGGFLVVRFDKLPVGLKNELRRQGYVHECSTAKDGTVSITISKELRGHGG